VFRGAQERSLGLRIKNGLRNLDPLVILMLAAMVCVLGSGILYLGARVHAPEESRMIITGPPDSE
jgi:hypothetical protein